MWPWARGQMLGHRPAAQAAPHATARISTVRSSPESWTPCWTREGAEQGPAPSGVGGTGGLHTWQVRGKWGSLYSGGFPKAARYTEDPVPMVILENEHSACHTEQACSEHWTNPCMLTWGAPTPMGGAQVPEFQTPYLIAGLSQRLCQNEDTS